jgi:hypothetical protein
VLTAALAKLRDPDFVSGKSRNKLAHNFSVAHAMLFQLFTMRLFSDRPTHDEHLFLAEDMPVLANVIRDMHAMPVDVSTSWRSAVLTVEATCRKFLRKCAWCTHVPNREVGVPVLEMADVCFLFLRRPTATFPFTQIDETTTQRIFQLLSLGNKDTATTATAVADADADAAL